MAWATTYQSEVDQKTGNFQMKTVVVTALWMKCLAILLGAGAAHANDSAKLWDALRQGTAFAIMRHALAPGTGDPDNFKVGDCSTQRNLSDTGRKRAREIGARFRSNGITKANVLSSQWCRCRETAELLALGQVKELPSLNSFFQKFEQRETQTKALRKWLMTSRPKGPLVLSTHQVNISALTGSYTSSGEIVVAQIDADGKVKVLGSIEN